MPTSTSPTWSSTAPRKGLIASYTFTNVTAEGCTIAATFAIDTNDITALAGPGGTVTPAGASAAPWGASLTYTITPDLNHHVVDVLVDGISAGAVASHTFTDVQTPHTIAASFAIHTHQLTYRAGAGGTISDTSPQTVDHGIGRCRGQRRALHRLPLRVLV